MMWLTNKRLNSHDDHVVVSVGNMIVNAYGVVVWRGCLVVHIWWSMFCSTCIISCFKTNHIGVVRCCIVCTILVPNCKDAARKHASSMASINTHVQPGQVHTSLYSPLAHSSLIAHYSSCYQVVCPGDVIATLPEEATVHIGPGVHPTDDALLAVRAGTFSTTKHGTQPCTLSLAHWLQRTLFLYYVHPATHIAWSKPCVLLLHKPTPPLGTLWVDTAQRRYVPARGDPVVGVITERYTENYHVHVHAAFPAQLSALAFEGATRRNKPNLQVDSVEGKAYHGGVVLLCPWLACVHDHHMLSNAKHCCEKHNKICHAAHCTPLHSWGMWCMHVSSPITKTSTRFSHAWTHMARLVGLVPWHRAI